MPYRDGTGPMGNGRMGRGMGPCGRGMGNGRRIGFGFRRCAPLTDKQTYADIYPYNTDELQARKKELEAQLNWINKELDKE